MKSLTEIKKMLEEIERSCSLDYLEVPEDIAIRYSSSTTHIAESCLQFYANSPEIISQLVSEVEELSKTIAVHKNISPIQVEKS